MNILICIKQVPDTTEIKIDPVTNTLIRAGVPSIINPYDKYALEAAARIKDKYPETKIIALSMGPEQAMAALKECLAIAADKAYLVSGRAFGGSDTLATSYILSCAIKKIEETEGPFQMIFCGKQAIDGDTAQVGPEIAEHLGLPQVTCALETEAFEKHLIVLRESEDYKEKIFIQYPCLITFTKPSFEPRYPNVKRKLAANRAFIPILGENAFPNIDFSFVGLKGSPTRVKKTFVPKQQKKCLIIQENDNTANASKLAALLNEAHII